MIVRLFNILIKQAVKMQPSGVTVTLRVKETVPVWSTPGIRILISSNGPAWTENRVASLFTAFAPTEGDPNDLGLDLLSAFFIVHHHGGDISVHKGPPHGPGFELSLPFDPEKTERPLLDQDYFEKIMMHFESWDSLRRDF